QLRKRPVDDDRHAPRLHLVDHDARLAHHAADLVHEILKPEHGRPLDAGNLAGHAPRSDAEHPVLIAGLRGPRPGVGVGDTRLGPGRAVRLEVAERGRLTERVYHRQPIEIDRVLERVEIPLAAVDPDPYQPQRALATLGKLSTE